MNNLGTIGKAGANIISLYVQDQWQIGDRLTLNLGIRTEDESVPTFRPDIKANAIAVRVRRQDRSAPWRSRTT